MADLLDTLQQAPLSVLAPHGEEKMQIPGQTPGINPLGCSEYDKMSLNHIKVKGF